MCSKKKESKKGEKMTKKGLISLSIGISFLVLLCASTLSPAAVSLDDTDPPELPEFYYISGNATYGGATPADGAQVTVINERTSEELKLNDVVGPSGASESSGQYLVEFNISSLEDGDIITVHIQGTGSYSSWVGTNQATVDTIKYVVQKVDVILTSTINNPPSSPSADFPLNGATGVNLNPHLRVMVSDPDTDPLSVTFYDGDTNNVIGTVESIQSGSLATVTWSGLEPVSMYHWYVVVSDSQLETESSVWSFTTQSSFNHAPSQPTLISPGDMSTDVSRSPSLRVTVSDPDGDLLQVTFYDATTNSIIGTVEGVESGSNAQFTWTGRSYDTTYQWYVVSSDTQLEASSDTWQFTTQSEPVTEKNPASPQNLVATGGDSATDIYAVLTWSAPSDPGTTAVTGYKIYRGREPGQVTLLDKTQGPITTYTDTGLEVNETYYYRVSAVNSIGEGVRSSEASLTTSDTTAPVIINAAVSPESFTADDTITITATVTDMSSIQEVMAVISVDGEEVEKVTLVSQGDNIYEGEWNAGDRDKYLVSVTASDIWDNERGVEAGELKHKDEGIPGFELVALLISFLVMLGALTVTRQLKKP